MAVGPPRIPPSVIRSMREGKFHGLSIQDQDEIYEIVEIMNNVGERNGKVVDWIYCTEHEDPNIDWCVKQIDKMLSKDT